MYIRDLLIADAKDLLRFEEENRSWFEQQIAPRPDSFFNELAVEDHIRSLVYGKQHRVFHPLVIISQQNKIIGRANLRDINEHGKTAEIGYRVGQAHTGKGIATSAARYLVLLAYTEWKLSEVRGFVSVANPASAKVLINNGFVELGPNPRLAVLKHGTFECIEYRYAFQQEHTVTDAN